MGLFRKTAYLASAGVIAPRSRKDRRHAQTIAAIQGKSADEIKAAGKSGRHDVNALMSPISEPIVARCNHCRWVTRARGWSGKFCPECGHRLPQRP